MAGSAPEGFVIPPAPRELGEVAPTGESPANAVPIPTANDQRGPIPWIVRPALTPSTTGPNSECTIAALMARAGS